MLSHTDIRCTLHKTTTADTHLGLALHGAFGKALRDQVCLMGPSQACVGCALVSHCPYPQVFQERPREGCVPWTPGYVFEWNETREDGFTVTLRVFGYLQKVVGVLERSLSRMRVFTQPDEKPVAVARILSTRHYETSYQDTLAPARFAIHLATPLHLKKQGNTLYELDLTALADTAQRRVDSLRQHYGADADASGKPGTLMTGAIREQNTAWKNMARFSHSQRMAHPVSGLTGYVCIEGADEGFYRLLKAAEITHIGKGVSFGLGRIRVEPLC